MRLKYKVRQNYFVLYYIVSIVVMIYILVNKVSKTIVLVQKHDSVEKHEIQFSYVVTLFYVLFLNLNIIFVCN